MGRKWARLIIPVFPNTHILVVDVGIAILKLRKKQL